MKTPIQELIDVIKQRINDDEALPYMYNERILELVESFLEKEKEFVTNFAMDYVFSGEVGCAIYADGPAELDIEKSARDYYNITFNTK